MLHFNNYKGLTRYQKRMPDIQPDNRQLTKYIRCSTKLNLYIHICIYDAALRSLQGFNPMPKTYAGYRKSSQVSGN